MNTNEKKQSSTSTRTIEQGQEKNTFPRRVSQTKGGFSKSPIQAVDKAVVIPNSKQFTNRIGMRYTRLLVIGFKGAAPGTFKWECLCDCGKIVVVRGCHLTTFHTTSCGCLKLEMHANRLRTHDMHKTPEYQVWAGMKKRCTNPNDKRWPYYGGRGIKVCQRWLDSFANFYSDMGPRPTAKHSIDRKRNNEGYSPDNCKWATQTEQCNNQRTNRILSLNGKSQSLAAWAREIGISAASIAERITRGWSLEKALTTPKTLRPSKLNALNDGNSASNPRALR